MLTVEYDIGHIVWEEIGFRGYNAGWNLKETGTIHWNINNSGATNSSGFSAFGGALRAENGGFLSSLRNTGYFWTSVGDTS